MMNHAYASVKQTGAAIRLLKGTDLFSWLVPLNENLPLTQVGIGAKSIMLNCRAKR